MDASGICLLLLLAVTAEGANTQRFQEDLHKIVQNPDLPANYEASATDTHTDCDSRPKCIQLCLKSSQCEATVYGGTNCRIYGKAFVNITESDQADNGLEYTESICSSSALNRPAYCAPVPPVYADCQEYYENGVTTSGVYTLKPEGYDSFDAWCDFDASHGWTVIQRRQDSQDFYLYWADYKAGFGDLEGSYWLGNDNIHALTQTNQMLNIYIRRYDNFDVSSNYTTFKINDESDEYRLTISGYSGNGGDAMAGGTGHSHNGQRFTTRDNDNDNSGSNCAASYTAAWWYNNCYHSSLNGQYCPSGSSNNQCAAWYDGGSHFDHSTSLSMVIMRVTRN